MKHLLIGIPVGLGLYWYDVHWALSFGEEFVYFFLYKKSTLYFEYIISLTPEIKYNHLVRPYPLLYRFIHLVYPICTWNYSITTVNLVGKVPSILPQFWRVLRTILTQWHTFCAELRRNCQQWWNIYFPGVALTGVINKAIICIWST